MVLPPVVVSVARTRTTVSAVTAGAVNSARQGSAVSSVTAGPAVWTQVMVLTPSPASGVGQARTETLPPWRTAWPRRSASAGPAVAAATSSVASAVTVWPAKLVALTR